MAIIIQQDATEYSLFKSVNCSTCFGWYFTHQFSSSHVQILCRYSVMRSWWWVKYHPKHVEQLTVLNKLYSVASCWIIIDILYDARSTEHKITTIPSYSLHTYLFTYLLHEEANWFSASPEIPRILWNPKVYQTVPILSQINPVHVPPPVPLAEDPS